MKTLKSYIAGRWHEADSGFVALVDPSTEEEIARVSSAGADFEAALSWARDSGGPALRQMSFSERGALLKAMARTLKDNREELLELSAANNGTTRSDGAFDIDGGGGTLAYYASLAAGLEGSAALVDGESLQLSRNGTFWGRHALVPRRGVAVHINAFNFPAWGFAEKAACALLAGMPVITKPATATALVAARGVELILEAEILPPGALQLVCGTTGDLLDRLGPQDVVAFTGSATTAWALRERPALMESNTRFNIEADSLNAAVLGPGAWEAAGATRELFLRDVVREITQKAGQKCTAVRRILVPRELLAEVEEALAEQLRKVVPGDPRHPETTMGPLATGRQLEEALAGLSELRQESRVIVGRGERVEGAGSPSGKGYFLEATLLRCDRPEEARALHRREVFAPVATLMPYDGDPRSAADLVARAGGTLVTSAYCDDEEWLSEFAETVASATGRLYLGSSESAPEAPGSGVALPQTLHGGPGRAGDGQELGGLRGVELYMQRLAIQGARGIVEGIAAESRGG